MHKNVKNSYTSSLRPHTATCLRNVATRPNSMFTCLFVRQNSMFTCLPGTKLQLIRLMRVRAFKTMAIVLENTLQCPVCYVRVPVLVQHVCMHTWNCSTNACKDACLRVPVLVYTKRQRQRQRHGERERERERGVRVFIECAFLCMPIVNACVLYLYAR